MWELTLYINTLSRLCTPSWDNKDHDKKISMWLLYESSHCTLTHCPEYVHCHGITKITRRLACDCCMRGLTLYIHTLSRLCTQSWDNKDHDKKISMWLLYESSHCTLTHCPEYVHCHGITKITRRLACDCCMRGLTLYIHTLSRSCTQSWDNKDHDKKINMWLLYESSHCTFTHCPDYVHRHGITKTTTRRLTCDCCMRAHTVH